MAAAAVILGTAAGSPEARKAAGATADADLRVEHSQRQRWQAGCDVDVCNVPTVFQISVTTPASVASVDVVVSTTLTHRITRLDWGLAVATYRLDGEQTRVLMEPGNFPITSPVSRTGVATMAWEKRSLPADGRTYVFSLSVAPRDGSGDGRVSIVGGKLSAVVEMSPAGP